VSTRVRALAVGLALCAVVACSDEPQAKPFATESPSPSPTVVASTAPPISFSPSPTPRPRRGSGRPITIAFAGDTHFEGASRSALSGGLAAITPALTAADLTILNLETAITERGTPAPKEYNFRAPATAFAALRRAGVDVVTGANNHGMDYGQVGLADTLAAAKAAKFPLVGLGRNVAEAFAPYRVTIRGQRVAVIGASQVLDGHLVAAWTATAAKPGMASAKEVDTLVAAVQQARATSDTVVIYLHWGTERVGCPTGVQQQLAGRLVDAGADIIVGGHAHILLGTGRLDGALVSYGLGNFIFYARPGPGAQTGVLTATVTGRDIDRYSWTPAVITGGVPRPLSGSARERAISSWQRLRGCTNLDP
jgi:poly-gamma-glutamate synthesis protein (capsule biosynthesis protein)